MKLTNHFCFRFSITFVVMVALASCVNVTCAQVKVDGAPPAELDESDIEVVELDDRVLVEDLDMINNPFGTVGQLLGAKQFYLQKIYAIEIKKINSVCQLDESQIAKLKVGAKGAVKKQVEEFRKSGLGMVIGVATPDEFPNDDGDGDRVDSELDEVEIMEVDDVNDLPEFTWQMIEMGNGPQEFLSYDLPTEHPLWAKIVTSTLTDEQYKNYAAACNEREEEVNAAIIDAGIKQFEHELGLSDAQSKQLRELIEPEVDSFKRLPKIYASFRFLFASAKVDPDQLKKFLDDDQFQRMQIIIMPIKDMVNMMDEDVGAEPAVLEDK
ncbi:MAG: hypothetical protein R3C03_16645 [Pirellulaceae bacterium]